MSVHNCVALATFSFTFLVHMVSGTNPDVFVDTTYNYFRQDSGVQSKSTRETKQAPKLPGSGWDDHGQACILLSEKVST